MLPDIDIEECLRDSPKFRASLELHEADIDQLEQKLDKVLKCCGVMVDTGKTYVSQQSSFSNALWDLSCHFRDEPDVTSHMNKLVHAMQEMAKFQTILLDQASRTVLQNLSSFVKKDIKGVKESRHFFEKISTDLDNALSRNSAAMKHRPAEVEEAANLLAATRSAFRHTALQHVRGITLVQSRKTHETLATLLSYLHACSTFFHQGSDLCQDLDPFFKKLADEVVAMRLDFGRLEKDTENCHGQVTSRDVVTPVNGDQHMEGYLFKRTSNAFKTWNRRWFSLQDSQLVYRKRAGDDITVMEEDLRLCTVKPAVDGDRRFCFEVLSPSKSHTLQADSEEMYLLWIAAMQRAIAAALQLSLSGSCKPDLEDNRETRPANGGQPNRKPRMWEQLLKIAGNNACCDCGSPDPLWASINLGITLCIECSGVHRSLGVHHSKVRSLTLDAWEPEIIKVMAELGNAIVNKVYEANVSEECVRATPKCTSEVRKAWITTKYLERKFVRQLSAPAGTGVRRKWSVRKLRRRARSRDAQRKLANVAEIPAAATKAAALHRDDSGESSSVSSELAAFADSLVEAEEADVLLFEVDLGEQTEAGVELGSDQDSTGGEEEMTEAEDMCDLQPDRLLHKAAAAHNLPVMCEALALGADKTWVNQADRQRSPIHQAVVSGSVMACEYLILNGARIDCQDEGGRSPLHLATELGHTAQVCLLLKHGANHRLEDNAGDAAIALAVRDANADIVTLLRLAMLNEEMKESESGGSDDTFNNVVRDFSQLACSHPERLLRGTRGGTEGD